MVLILSVLLISVLSHLLEIGIATGGNRGKRGKGRMAVAWVASASLMEVWNVARWIEVVHDKVEWFETYECFIHLAVTRHIYI